MGFCLVSRNDLITYLLGKRDVNQPIEPNWLNHMQRTNLNAVGSHSFNYSAYGCLGIFCSSLSMASCSAAK